MMPKRENSAMAGRNELVGIIDTETELLDACAAWAKGKTQVERMMKASKIANALRALMTGVPKKPRTDPALRQIFAIRGLPLRVAHECKISRQAIDAWKKVPPRHVDTVSRIIGMSPHEIRPDLVSRAGREQK